VGVVQVGGGAGGELGVLNDVVIASVLDVDCFVLAFKLLAEGGYLPSNCMLKAAVFLS
jgi:hypothetical protein